MARAMKDSGIAWIGEIPEEWEVGRIGNLYAERKEKVSDRNFPPLSVTMKGILPQLSTAAKTDSHDDRKLVCLGDFAINSRSDRRGSCGISPYDGSVSLINIILTPRREMHPVYYNWLFHSTMFSDEFYKWGHGIVDDLWTTNWQDMKRITVPIPDYREQERIANYLDAECARIDAVIEQTRASIEEYKKLKQAVITQAVTKGIRPNRPMKDSGIKWVSGVPCDWNTPKVLQCLKMPITDGPHTTPELFDEGIPFISAEAVSTGNGRISFDHMRGYISQEFYEECCKKYIPQIDDVYMIKSGATTGRVAIVDTDRVFTIWSPLAVFRADKERILPMFLFYSLQADYVQKQIENGWSYGTQQNIGMRVLERIKLCVPPVNEQSSIVAYLDEKISRVNHLIAIKERILSELENYKKSLIFEYVTGKKEVR